MELDIDVSGEDVLSRNFTVCVADRDNIIKGYKISSDFMKIISSSYGQSMYKYKKSNKGRALLKVRVYCIIIYCLFKSIKIRGKVFLNVCRDFDGKENDIKSNLEFFLEKLLNIEVSDIRFCKLRHESNAHRYAYLMRKDTKNQMKTYIKIAFKDIEKFLRK